MYTITKSFTFDAAHHLPHLPSTHKCSRPHGHTYTVTVELSSNTLDPLGFVRDYGELNVIRSYINEHLDHRDLNQIFPITTAESLAEKLYYTFRKLVPELTAVTVCETPTTSATFRHTFSSERRLRADLGNRNERDLELADSLRADLSDWYERNPEFSNPFQTPHAHTQPEDDP